MYLNSKFLKINGFLNKSEQDFLGNLYACIISRNFVYELKNTTSEFFQFEKSIKKIEENLQRLCWDLLLLKS